jgi:hypothetical protein
MDCRRCLDVVPRLLEKFGFKKHSIINKSVEITA